MVCNLFEPMYTHIVIGIESGTGLQSFRAHVYSYYIVIGIEFGTGLHTGAERPQRAQREQLYGRCHDSLTGLLTDGVQSFRAHVYS